MKTSVVVATKNSVKTIKQCLSSLMPYFESGYISEIVAVDAYSSDGTLDIVEMYPVKLLFDKRKGLSVAYEIGWRNTREEFVLFLDSDAYLEAGFFPMVYEFFQDNDIGMVGAEARNVIVNGLSAITDQWNMYHNDRIKKMQSRLPLPWYERIYGRVVWFDEPQVTITGPCYIVRRNSLEAVNGFLPYQRIGGEDYNLSERIMKAGSNVTWWLGAPVRHYSRSTLKELGKQYFGWGRRDTLSWKGYYNASRFIAHGLKLLCAPVIGLMCALRYKNPLHLPLFTFAKYAQFVGYLYGLISHEEIETSAEFAASYPTSMVKSH